MFFRSSTNVLIHIHFLRPITPEAKVGGKSYLASEPSPRCQTATHNVSVSCNDLVTESSASAFTVACDGDFGDEETEGVMSIMDFVKGAHV
jgi:hypothetical protein